MEITKLELKGFKSFADNVVINFDQGITGVVGPNGCGKSNIVDAIRWVLGEQKTRILRSEKMENVIFNGSKARKATNLARVALTFNNTKNLIPTEYSSVSIERRYYRSGESEYLLNGVSCRLKDITNLFLDTGISANSYAIIELKMIDDILNDKENSRRVLFEEAAGVSKFKMRKHETLRKLEQTESDLDRVEDLVFEIEKNLKSLEKQSRQAKNFNQLKEDYQRHSIALAQLSYNDFIEKNKKVVLQIEKKDEQKITLVKQTNQLEAKIEQSKTSLIEKEMTLSSEQKTLNSHVEEIRNQESKKQIKNEQHKFLTDKIYSLEKEITQHNDSKKTLDDTLIRLNDKKENTLDNVRKANSELNTLKNTLEKNKTQLLALQEDFEEKNKIVSSEKEQYFQISKEVEIFESQLRSFNQEITKSSTEKELLQENVHAFNKEIEVLHRREKELLSSKNVLQTTHEKATKNIEKTESKILLEKEKGNEIEKKISVLQNQLDLTQSLVDNLEGFPTAIQYLKKQPKHKNLPLLLDIITCEDEYKVAVEHYLSNYLNHYIVKKQEEALEAIQSLYNNRQGRANFFVLQGVDKASNTLQKNLPKDAISMVDVISTEEKYTDLISSLVKDVYIVTDDTKITDSLITVSKDGRFYNKKHMVSGGSVGLFEGKQIGKKQNIALLSKEISQLGAKSIQINDELSQLKTTLQEYNAQLKNNEIAAIEKTIIESQQTLSTYQIKLEQTQQLINAGKSKQGETNEQIALLNQTLQTKRSELLDIQKKIKISESEEQKSKEHLKSCNNTVTSETSLFNEKNVSLINKQNQLNSIDQEIQHNRNLFQQHEKSISLASSSLKQTEINIKDLNKSDKDDENILVKMYETKDKISQKVNELEKVYYATRGGVDEIEKEVRNVRRQRENLDDEISELHTQQNELQINLRLIIDKIKVEFAVDLASYKQDLSEITALTQEVIGDKIDRLKKKIENTGPINLMAMDAYDELRNRYELITTQKEDLNNARISLLDTIKEIDSEVQIMFRDAFEKIKNNFIKVFRTLFSEEDTCDLVLSTDENVLESKIEIIAKPKGKRPLTINQLSGGEKTLTATALLFAIYLLKPAPFCIFDEVDAPLDDENIDKFNRLVREFSKDSQFIIVTHNKKTMVNTDVIYGVTMSQAGVSQLVPADLRKLD